MTHPKHTTELLLSLWIADCVRRTTTFHILMRDAWESFGDWHQSPIPVPSPQRNPAESSTIFRLAAWPYSVLAAIEHSVFTICIHIHYDTSAKQCALIVASLIQRSETTENYGKNDEKETWWSFMLRLSTLDLRTNYLNNAIFELLNHIV